MRQHTTLAAAFLMFSALGAAYAAMIEPRQLVVERIDVPIAGLPDSLDGLRIAQLSDLHHSPQVRATQIRRAVEVTNRLQPDLTVVTGDFVSRGYAFAEEAVHLVAPLRARLGVFAVLGNRDHSSLVADYLTEGLRRAGVQVLRNASEQLPVEGGTLWLVGVDDVLEGQDDWAEAFSRVPEHTIRLLLVHEPDVAETAARYSVDLQLSGHTHGGQIVLPPIGPLLLPALGRRYPSGLRRVPGSRTQIYTSRGIGVARPALRFNCPPEITLIRLIGRRQ